MGTTIIKFKPKGDSVTEGNNITDGEALANLENLKGILRSNMKVLDCEDQQAFWSIMCGSPFDFANKPRVKAFVSGFYKGMISRLLDNLNSQVVTDNYLKSAMVEELDTAMHLLNADHLTRIQLCLDGKYHTLVLHRTFDTWCVVNLYINGKSMHDFALTVLCEDLGYSTDDLFNNSESKVEI